jgi:hypothetical protein
MRYFTWGGHRQPQRERLSTVLPCLPLDQGFLNGLISRAALRADDYDGDGLAHNQTRIARSGTCSHYSYRHLGQFSSGENLKAASWRKLSAPYTALVIAYRQDRRLAEAGRVLPGVRLGETKN